MTGRTPIGGVPMLSVQPDDEEEDMADEPASTSTPPLTDRERIVILERDNRYTDRRLKGGARSFTRIDANLAHLSTQVTAELARVEAGLSAQFEKKLSEMKPPPVSWWAKFAVIVTATVAVGGVFVALARLPDRAEFREALQEMRKAQAAELGDIRDRLKRLEDRQP